MITEGQTVLFKFPNTDQGEGKLRPALVLRRLPGKFNDWLICMISSQVAQLIPELDEMLKPEDSDFKTSGLKVASVVRSSRLAVVSGEIFIGKLGVIHSSRLARIKRNLSNWIMVGT